MKRLIETIDRSLDWRWLPTLSQEVIRQALSIQQIPAPTFSESRRAAYVAQQFRALNLAKVDTDSLNNVYGLWQGKDQRAPSVLISAHTDTVFPEETVLTIRTEGQLIYGPGLGDNSIGVAALIGVAHALRARHIQSDGNVWLVATVGEEGLGDLRGMRAAFNELKAYIQAVINIEGLAFEHVYHAGIAVRRLHITAHADGGHSWLNFGRPSAIHGILQLGARLTLLQPPSNPRTTFNVGIIEGGQSINTIASRASLWLDLRSEDQAALAELEQQVRSEVQTLSSTELEFSVQVVGDRPAGRLPPSHPLVQAALAALAQVGSSSTLETGSTDANIPLASGCPAVTIGLTRGGNAHRLDEYIDTEPLISGLRQLFLLILAATSRENL